MKNIYRYLVCCFLLIYQVFYSQSVIGFGINSPRGALDINLETKTNTMGLVLPIVKDTIQVINPMGGSIIPGTIVYDKVSACMRYYKIESGVKRWSDCL